ncbi:GNAT family N-acetyltransferase [Mucilaginibacter sp. X4EP1]|uniref:GNAT family N-acetyltransferase n=1 Tax=Mucilaginibacter sp. X4EP1 TaxID=2723092 RepID=UPI0021697C86|nr:N-acetyltransferase [Mucilaginibacter sp. X4EP1]MCS3815380.1 ribosomal protein S18 acetylase RimI-like enzyme [Mucilaginibacter sp. X4EP1]
MLTIRKAVAADHDEIWKIIKEVIVLGDTYVFSPNSSKEKMLNFWCSADKQVYVALFDDKIAGTFFIKDNQPDLGSHIANAGYMASSDFSGKGIGKQMGLFSIEEARRLGYKAMQFNIVIKSNQRAVALWQKLDFEIIGEIPDAFNHPQNGMTNAYIMYRKI